MLKKELLKLLEQVKDDQEVVINIPGYKERPHTLTQKMDLNIENVFGESIAVIYPFF